MRMKKKAARNIAMMMVQIASILIAVVVIASVVQFVNKTKEKGASIPKSTLGLAKTGFTIKDITGFSIDNNNSDIEGMIISVSPEAGSDAINLERSTLYILIGNRTARLHITNGTIQNSKLGGFYTE